MLTRFAKLTSPVLVALVLAAVVFPSAAGALGSTSQAITFTNSVPVAPHDYVNATYFAAATGGGSGNLVTFSVDPSSTSGCTVTASTGFVTLAAPAGSCVIDANQAGNATYANAPQVSQTTTSVLAPPQLTFYSAAPTSPTVGTVYYAYASDADTLSPIVYSVDASSTSGCTVDAATGLVTLTAPAGTCSVNANQVANAAFLAAVQVTQSVTSVKAPQTLTFITAPPSTAPVNSVYLAAVSYGGSGNPVTFSIDPSSTSGCVVGALSGVVTLAAPAGTCVINANQAGNAGYLAAATISQSLSSVLSSQTILFLTSPPPAPFVNDTYLLDASSGGSGNPVTFSIDHTSTSGCVVGALSGVVTFLAPAGTCVIDANQAGNTAFTAAPQVQQAVTSILAPQSISFTNAAPTNPHANSHYTATVQAGLSGNPVTFSVDHTSTSGCVVGALSGVVTLIAPAGTCVIDANQAGSSAYTAAPQVTQTVTSSLIPQVLTIISTPPPTPGVGATYTVTAVSTSSGSPIVYSIGSGSTSGCTVNASTGFVSLNAPIGTCIIDVNQVGVTGSYAPAVQVQQSVATSVLAQTLVFTSVAPTSPKVGAIYTVSAKGGASGNLVIFTVDPSSTSGCTVTLSDVVLSAPAGTCVIDANQAGSPGYLAATQVQQAVTSANAAAPAVPPTLIVTVPGTRASVAVSVSARSRLSHLAAQIQSDHLTIVAIVGYSVSPGFSTRALRVETYLKSRLHALGDNAVHFTVVTHRVSPSSYSYLRVTVTAK